MKKIFLVIFMSLSLVTSVKASVIINAPSSVYVGEKVTVKVNISSGSVYAAGWEFNVYFDDSILYCDENSTNQTGVSCGHVAVPAGNSNQSSVEFEWVLTARKSGSATFSVSNIDVLGWNEGSIDVGGPASTSINVIKPSSGGNGGSTGGGSNNGGYSDYKYSDDNNLSSLNIEGFDIDFDSSVTEYSVSVPNDTKKVKIGATANDGNAYVSGIGDYDVKEGNNEIKIVVTAENGDTKTYTVNVVVKELSPIEVKVGDKSYSVVRKSDNLPKANATYKSSTILIKGESVPCYHSEITDIYLVGLMDDKGKAELFNYDSKSDKFSTYNELNISGLYIVLIDNKDVPVGYKSGLVKIGDKEYNGYLKDGSYSLLYGINLETGEKNFYSYDSSESTLQKYAKVSVSNNKYYSYIIFGLIGLCVFEFIMIIVAVVSKNKQLKKFLHNKLDVKTDYEQKIETASDDSSYDSFENDASELSGSEDNELSESDDNISDSSENTDLDNYEMSDEEGNNEMEESEEDDSTEDKESDESDVSFDTEEIEEGLGHTALISRNVTNVYNNTKNRKESIKERKTLRKKKKKNKDDDDMFKF